MATILTDPMLLDANSSLDCANNEQASNSLNDYRFKEYEEPLFPTEGLTADDLLSDQEDDDQDQLNDHELSSISNHLMRHDQATNAVTPRDNTFHPHDDPRRSLNQNLNANSHVVTTPNPTTTYVNFSSVEANNHRIILNPNLGPQFPCQNVMVQNVGYAPPPFMNYYFYPVGSFHPLLGNLSSSNHGSTHLPVVNYGSFGCPYSYDCATAIYNPIIVPPLPPPPFPLNVTMSGCGMSHVQSFHFPPYAFMPQPFVHQIMQPSIMQQGTVNNSHKRTCSDATIVRTNNSSSLESSKKRQKHTIPIMPVMASPIKLDHRNTYIEYVLQNGIIPTTPILIHVFSVPDSQYEPEIDKLKKAMRLYSIEITLAPNSRIYNNQRIYIPRIFRYIKKQAKDDNNPKPSIYVRFDTSDEFHFLYCQGSKGPKGQVCNMVTISESQGNSRSFRKACLRKYKSRASNASFKLVHQPCSASSSSTNGNLIQNNQEAAILIDGLTLDANIPPKYLTK
ncbi:hypothetical protein C9374_013692 [Naegleria lovaniensis]|uniref:Uncharacterized protein n=1 Tax=Naegleria lovaniensis TaxID=51637 RepID=A0AA88GD32_NAELO|nr:uncharacterized protein C9374_013692 [Naegleria lovaniensis]KAG2372628.1 hypothetical protein C9374_013692 [Naegleria lovaniensis]